MAETGSSAVVSRASGAPDLSLSLSVEELGAAHLGGTPLADPALAGRVAEHRPGALAEATRAWSWSPAPWCPEVF